MFLKQQPVRSSIRLQLSRCFPCMTTVHIAALGWGFSLILWVSCRSLEGVSHLVKFPGQGRVERGLSRDLSSSRSVLWPLPLSHTAFGLWVPPLKTVARMVSPVDTWRTYHPISKLICCFYTQSLERFSGPKNTIWGKSFQSTDVWVVLS